MNFLEKNRPLFNTPHLIIYGFAIVILAATFILMLPISSAGGEWTNFVDAMFTATTSVCVTGLVVVPTYAYWSLFGKTVIFILIQLGGLGVVCIMMGFFILIKKKITLKERRLIQESYNFDTSGGMVKVVIRVFKATFLIEGMGAALYSIRFIPRFGFVKGVCYSIFHSVSAFCNAGIDLLGDSSLAAYCGDGLINFTTMFLIVSGGIGFIVWWDILKVCGEIKRGNLVKNKIFERLSLHSKMVISATVIFIFAGAVVIFLFEYTNGDTIGNMKVGKKILTSLFESVTLRTAGFSTISQSGFRMPTLMFICFFMFVGGSPMGTAGGIKTTTIGILFVEVLSVVRGKKHAEVFRRKIHIENVRTAISVSMISFLSAIAAIMLLSFTEQAPFKAIVFEVFSAVGTVGLSMDLTSALSPGGRLIIIFMMFLGRVGPITMAMAFASKRKKSLDRDFPEKRIIIG